MFLPYLVGVLFEFYSDVSVNYVFINLGLFFILTFLNLPVFSKERILSGFTGLIITVLFFFLGGWSVKSKQDFNKESYFYKPDRHNYQLYINQPLTEKEKSIKLNVDVMSRDGEKTFGKSMIYIEKTLSAKQLTYGDILFAQIKFSDINTNGNPMEFDYQNYLHKSYIYHQAYIDKFHWQRIGNQANPLFNFTYATQKYLSNLLEQSSLKKDNVKIAKALLLGQKEDLDKDTLKSYSSAGAMHVLAVSGLHVGIIMLILMFLLNPLKRIVFGKTIYVFLIVFCLWFYAFITGLSPSVLRSALMFSFVIIGKELQRETSIYQSILVSAFVLVIINPLVIFKVGFQLSYLAVLGIVYLQPKIYNLIYFKYKILDYIWKISSVSIAAQFATFPLGLYYFHQFPNYFFISNLIVIPLAGLILIFGLSFFFLFKINLVNDIVIFILDLLLSFLNVSVAKVEQLPYSILWGISISWYEALVIYISIALLLFSFTLKKAKLLLLSGVAVILLLGLFMINKYKLSNTNQLIVYNVKNEIAIDVFYGQNNYFISSDSLYNDDEKMLFNIKHNWFKIRQSEKPYRFLSLTHLNYPILNLNQKSVAIINHKLYIADIVILGDLKELDLNYLEELKHHKSVIVISSKTPYKVKEKIKKIYPSQWVYNLTEKGAFIFSF